MDDESDFYELTPQEFERLAARFLQAEGAKDVDVVGGPNDQGVDIVATYNGQPIVAQVKHTRQLKVDTARNGIATILAGAYQPTEIIYVTSADVSPADRAAIEQPVGNVKVRLVARQDLIAARTKNPGLASATIARARKRSRQQVLRLFTAILGMILSIGAAVFQFARGFHRPPLNERIETVEKAIGSEILSIVVF